MGTSENLKDKGNDTFNRTWWYEYWLQQYAKRRPWSLKIKVMIHSNYEAFFGFYNDLRKTQKVLHMESITSYKMETLVIFTIKISPTDPAEVLTLKKHSWFSLLVKINMSRSCKFQKFSKRSQVWNGTAVNTQKIQILWYITKIAIPVLMKKH